MKLNNNEQPNIRRGIKSTFNFQINKEIVACESIDSVLELIGEHLDNFNVVNIGTCLYRLVVLTSNCNYHLKNKIKKNEHFINLVNEIIAMCIEEEDVGMMSSRQSLLTPKELSNIVWACTKINYSNSDLFSKIAAVSLPQISLFNTVNLSLTLWGFAKLDMANNELFAKSVRRIICLIDDFEPHRLCNIIWAYSKLKYTHYVDLYSSAANSMIRNIQSYSVNNGSMMFYSLVLADFKHYLIYDIICRKFCTVAHLREFNTRCITNLLYATSAVISHDLWINISQMQLDKLFHFVEQSVIYVTQTLSAYSTNQIQSIVTSIDMIGLSRFRSLHFIQDFIDNLSIEKENERLLTPALNRWKQLIIQDTFSKSSSAMVVDHKMYQMKSVCKSNTLITTQRIFTDLAAAVSLSFVVLCISAVVKSLL